MFTLRPPEKPSWAVTGPETAPILNVLANFASNAGLARRGSGAVKSYAQICLQILAE